MSMLTAADERARLSSLRHFEILDTPREQAFDDIAELAAQICGTPIGIINLVDADRQWGKAIVGLDDTEAPREDSFCARTIEWPEDLMIVPDTHDDPRFAENPMVLGDPHLRFYAGTQITDREGYALGSVCVADRIPRDLTDQQKRALAALGRQAIAQMELRLALRNEREQVARLEELDRMRDQFVSTVSHELRSPLTSIRGWIDLLLEEAEVMDPGHVDALQRVSRNTDRLTRVVGDLLDLYQVDAGDLAMRFEPVDLAAIVRDAVHGMEAGERCAALDVRASVPSDAVIVSGDAPRLAQVVDNLCSNAVKYTPEGGTVRVSLDIAGDSARLCVADSGIGIPAAEREHLFERFFRASSATERDIKGTGLGLAISKAIVERHCGRIEVADGDGGVGTAFTVVLPLSP
jgi:signal transduction histidine kinase